MPIYEYQCQACGFRFDKLIRSMTAAPEVICEKCHSVEVEKLVSMVSCHGLSKGGNGGSSSSGGSSCGGCSGSHCSTCK
jgi:putative FmdB family regulatory protein